MKHRNLVIGGCVLVGLLVGAVVGWLLADFRTYAAVGALAGLAVGFALTGGDPSFLPDHVINKT